MRLGNVPSSQIFVGFLHVTCKIDVQFGCHIESSIGDISYTFRELACLNWQNFRVTETTFALFRYNEAQHS